jgi:hypothetical protein
VLGRPLWGKRTKSCMYTYHRYAHNPRARCFRPQCSNYHNLLETFLGFVRGLSIYVYQLFIPIDLRA